ncbi:MAG: hypothetical protein QNK05_05890 [Myxococcota bacterium]|nr:hypothetical protein [Myxococcota bacterium]
MTRALAMGLVLLFATGCRGEPLADWVAALDEQGYATTGGGAGHWLLTSELRHVAAGRFWGDAAAAVSRSTRPEWADPLPVVVDFHEQLEAAGIALLLVPVPAKIVVLPETVPAHVAEEERGGADRAFLDELRGAGVRVLDLTTDLASEVRAAPYCRTDSHWSGAGAELAAARIAAALRDVPGLDAVPRSGFESELRDVAIQGDLSRLPGGETIPAETLSLRFVGTKSPGGLVPIAPDRESPVLLLADSHGLVFHAGGDMLAQGAGLPDQLALELGYAVDLVAVRGAASTAARMSLLRRGPEALAGKRAVVWVFSVREWTQSSQGWRPLPLSLPAAKPGSPGSPGDG